jgi:RNA polymerase sigma-70 factor (ECF subfamily)
MGARLYRLAMIDYTVEMVGHELRERAFEHEAMPHTASLLRAAISITRDSAVAEDLVQETLLRAWRFFDRFDPGTNCKAWLFRIMLNLSTRVREKRTAESLSSVPLDETHADQASTSGDHLQQLLIRHAFEALPQEQRSVLHLAIVDGFTCKEIAELLSLPMGTVMSRLSRGRVSLRDHLTGQELARGKGMC